MNSFRNNIAHHENFWIKRKTILNYCFHDFMCKKHWYIRQLNMIGYLIEIDAALV